MVAELAWPFSLRPLREHYIDVHQQANYMRKANRQVRMSRLLTTFTENPNDSCGSLAEIVGSQRFSSAIKRSAEPIRYPFSAAIGSQFGQEQISSHPLPILRKDSKGRKEVGCMALPRIQ